MRLSKFIEANREPILVEWEAFARTCTPAAGIMNIADLRDHANQMLTVIAADLETPQDGQEQSEKSKGQAPEEANGNATAAEEHGAGRAESGFTVEQMISEYRALRASVIRLWIESEGAITPDRIDDLTRFNEAIDQSLAESIARYTKDLAESREMFLAILGHDLRTPLSAVFTSSRFMLDTGELQEPHLTLTSRIANSSTRMVHLVGDLLDFTRTRLGGGIPIACEEVNMGRIVHDVVDELKAAHPDSDCGVRVDARGELDGCWDEGRMSQALANLIGNALQHGTPGMDVDVAVQGDNEEVSIAVQNRGVAIPHEKLASLFHPMKADENDPATRGPTGNLGLGLYIAERIVHAHGGRIAVDSSEEGGTTFRVHLPRRAQPEDAK